MLQWSSPVVGGVSVLRSLVFSFLLTDLLCISLVMVCEGFYPSVVGGKRREGNSRIAFTINAQDNSCRFLRFFFPFFSFPSFCSEEIPKNDESGMLLMLLGNGKALPPNNSLLITNFDLISKLFPPS